MRNKADVNVIKACILGHAVGDALGVPVEFCSREWLDNNPVTNMRDFGSYPYPAGCWSDDTSMTLCALESLAKGKLDFNDIMDNFGKWYYKDEFTPTGEMFDVGNTCSFAIDNYFKNKSDTEHCGLTGEQSNGNGSLMRIIPFVLFAYYTMPDFRPQKIWGMISEASAITHAHPRSRVGCEIYAMMLTSLLHKPDVSYIGHDVRLWAKCNTECSEYNAYKKILSGEIGYLKRDEIKSTGYVVDTLEAALWCIKTTSSYRECVLKAVNLGDDTDTVAAVAGGLAGALYGIEAIPKEWLDTLKRREYIEELCEKAAEAWSEAENT